MNKNQRICQHEGWDDERDCEQEAEYTCMCCNYAMCSEHKWKECEYGGMGFLEL